MTQITIPNDFTPRPYQLELFAAMDSGKYKRALLVWPRQVGKDTSCFAYMIKRAAETPGNYYYVFPSGEQARKALWEKVMVNDGRKLLELLPLDPKLGIVTRLSNMEMIIELYNNSTIRLSGADSNINALRGITPSGIVFSEFAFTDNEAYKAISPAIEQQPNCWAIFNSTPNGRNHFYSLYEGARTSKNWFVSYRQALWPDKKNYLKLETNIDFDEQVKLGQSTWEDIEREYGCSFATGLKGSFYADQLERLRNNDQIGHFPYDPSIGVCTYWDIGARDDTAIWFVQHKNRSCYIIDYYEAPGKGTDELAQMLEDKEYRYIAHYLPHDADNVRQGKTITTVRDDLEESLHDFRVDGDIEVIDKWPSKQAGILAARKLLPRCYFNHSNTLVGLDRLELYHRKFDKKRAVFLKDPVHDCNSHAADAFRTLAQADDEFFNKRFKDNKGHVDVTGLDKYDPFN